MNVDTDRLSASCTQAVMSDEIASAPSRSPVDHRLRKHADYQRVYREGRKQFSASMSYFFSAHAGDDGPRVGLTVGRVIGKAVQRNRIKRRMREIVRKQLALLPPDVDVVLHPRRSVLTIEFAKLEQEVARIFLNIQTARGKSLRVRS